MTLTYDIIHTFEVGSQTPSGSYIRTPEGNIYYIILTRGDLIDEQEFNSTSSASERLREESDCNISCMKIGRVQLKKAIANKPKLKGY